MIVFQKNGHDRFTRGRKKPKTVTHFTNMDIVTHFITYAEAIHSLGFIFRVLNYYTSGHSIPGCFFFCLGRTSGNNRGVKFNIILKPTFLRSFIYKYKVKNIGFGVFTLLLVKFTFLDITILLGGL